MKHISVGFAVIGGHTVAPEVPQCILKGLDEVFEDKRSQHEILWFDPSCQAMLCIVNCVSVNTPRI